MLLLATLLPLCWLLMLAVHELGHVLAAWATGGTVVRVVLYPWAISRTDVLPNPSPRVVAWAGPLLGCLLPLTLLAISSVRTTTVQPLICFFAGFCLIANGAYLAFGSLDGIGDAGDLMRMGTPQWCLWLFGAITIPLGLRLWHGLGPSFGLGDSGREFSRFAAYLSLALLILTLILELLLSGSS
jgi:hypothetical protein